MIRFKSLIKLFTLSMCIPAAAFSQATDDIRELSLKDLLDVKITTVSKSSENLDFAPAAVIVITRQQIRERGYRSLLDVMHDLPDYKVDDKMYSGMRNSFMVRGIRGQDKFVMLLDGISISSPSGEPMPIMENYPVNLAEQIEVVYGPASALYGANAVAGVINIITRKTDDFKDVTADVSATGGTGGYTDNSIYIAKKIGNKASLILSGQYSYDRGIDYSKEFSDDSLYSIDGYKSGTLNSIFGPQTPSTPITPAYEAPLSAYNVYAALRIEGFNLSVFRNSSTTPTAYGNNTSNAVYNKDVAMIQNVTVLSTSYTKMFGRLTSTSRIMESMYNLDPKSNYRNLYTNEERAYKYGMTSEFSAEQQIDYRITNNFDVIGGVSFEHYNAIPQSTDLSAPVKINDYIQGYHLGTQSYYHPEGIAAPFYYLKYYNIGNYLQAQFSPVHSISLTLGARYDINTRYGNTFNPRMGIVIRPVASTTVKLMYGSAFLAAIPTSAYAQYGAFETLDSGKTYHSYFLHLPNADLKPIRSQNFEMNVKQYLTENFSVTLDGYYSLLMNMYVTADDNETTHLYNNMYNGIPVDYIEVFVNKSRQKNYGGSIRFEFNQPVGQIRTNSYITFSYCQGLWEDGNSESEESMKDQEIEALTPLLLHAGTDIKTGKFTFSPRITITGKQNIGGIGDTTATVITRQTLPGYALLNVNARFNVNSHLGIYLNVQNALNQTYTNVSYNMDKNVNPTELFYGQKQDPIRFYGGVNITF